MIIEQPARFLRWIYPHAIWRMDPTVKAVYLTFDDGPIPEATPYVLDTLAHYGVHATFFVVGDNVRKYPHIFRQIIAQGHRVGNHTYNHIGGLRYLSKNYLLNTQKAQQEIETHTHSSPHPTGASPLPTGEGSGVGLPPLFRPPHGWMRTQQYRAIRRQGYQIIMWDLVTRDYSRRLTPQDVLNNVIRYARNGSIITFHDSIRSIDKLQQILHPAIQYLISQGYQFRTL